MNRRQRRRDAKAKKAPRKRNATPAINAMMRGLELVNAGNLDGAAAAFQEATKADAAQFAAWANLGSVELERGNPLAAETAFARALELDVRSVPVISNLANLKMQLDARAEAEVLYRRALVEAPDDGELYYDLSRIKKFTADDPDLAAMESADSRSQSSGPSRMYLHFALGKAYEDIENFEKSIKHYLDANTHKRATLAFDINTEEDLAQQLIATFPSSVFLPGCGNMEPEANPIFVLGMPRSGTSLVEQILASHSDVFGAGEVNFMRDSIASVFSTHQLDFPTSAGNLDASAQMALGLDYMTRLRTVAPVAKRITDKMPRNVYFIGLIAMALPNAKIIHCRRSALDTCLSCFTIHFPHGQEFSYDLKELGRYYRAYAGLMEHWQRALPGRILDVRYEDLVVDPEAQIRRLTNHCDLSWEEAVLNFDKTERQISTASAAQVRQPVHTGSVARWKRFGSDLHPLIAALGSYADENEG